MSDTLKKLLFTVLAQVPLFGGLWAWWGQVRTRPAAVVILGVLYEAGILVFTFGKKVWEKELEAEAIKITADWVRGTARGFAPGFRSRYKEQVINDHGVFNVRGLGLINTYTLSLDQVFVDLRVDPSNPQKFNLDPIAQRDFTGNRPVWDFLHRSESRPHEAAALAIIGPPGCGKTTLLQHVAVTLAGNRQRRYRARASTPLLLFLRDHTRSITQEKPPSLGKLAQDYFNDGSQFATLKPPPDWFERQLEGGKCMVLLDGLDEVADPGQRKVVSSWVDTQIKNYPRCRFILTARPQGYSDAPLQRAHVLEVQPFNARQVRRFIESWYLANEIVSSGGHNTPAVRQRARKDAEDLLHRLRALPSLNALTVNPLLLTMIAMVHRYHGALPGSRVELYAEICEVLLGRWRQSRGVQDSLKATQKLVVLQPLAAHMMKRKLRDITTDEAITVITQPLRRVGIMGDTAEKFLKDLQAGSGLLLEREARQWSFAHLTFQEYLTAAHWLEQKNGNLRWGELVSESWWHETLRLYAAQGDATPLVEACLEVDTIPALMLAADCLDEAREILPEVRCAAEQRVINDLESIDPARRRVAAEVQLTRRLKYLQRIDDLREIDLEYLSCAEYQLFLDDVRAMGEYVQPSHWNDLTFSAGDARKPVAGMWAQDAVGFFKWLERRQGGNVHYRLPRVEEAEQHPPKKSELSAWCVENAEYFEDFQLIGLVETDKRRNFEQIVAIASQPSSLRQDLVTALKDNRDPILERGNNFAAYFFDFEYALRIARTGIEYFLNDGMWGSPLWYPPKDAGAIAASLVGDGSSQVSLTRNPEQANREASHLAEQIGDALLKSAVNRLPGSYDVRRVKSLSGLAETLESFSERFPDKATLIVVELLDLILKMTTSKKWPEVWQAQTEYLMRLLDYAYQGFLIKEENVGLLRRWGHGLRKLATRLPVLKRRLRSWSGERSFLMGPYLTLQIDRARRNGSLPVWEGIRIVREQIVEGSKGKEL
jgi:energy-coupling factor transporter ATP-binding protein EcfA2